MKPHLETIIHGDQKGFVAGRYIGETIRTTFDVMQWAKNNNKTGVLLLIDFEKAYDSLSFKYIQKCLQFFNFGEYIINWINILLYNFSAVVNHCGNISQKFNIGRGARQGDPIASYLFIVCIEILALKLRTDSKIQGFKVRNMTKTLELYADDCSIFLEPSDRNLRNCLEILDNFFKLSGLKISVSKTKAIWFGVGCNNPHQLCPDLKLDWSKSFRLLGIDFCSDLVNMDCNFDNKINEIRSLFNCWLNRTLTIYGKITVVKTLALSKLSHLPLVLPNLGDQKLKVIENLILNFIWDNKPAKVAKDHAKLSEKAGGLGLTDIKTFWQSLKFSWLRRLLSTSSFWPKILEAEVSDIVNKEVTMYEILQYGPNYLTTIGKKLKNKFWGEVFCSVSYFMQGAIYCLPENIVIAPLWNNPSITKNNKPLKGSAYPNLSTKITTISDFFHPGSANMCTKNELENKFNVVIDNNTYTEFKYIIQSTRRSLGIADHTDIKTFFPYQPLLIKIANSVKKGCSLYYKLIRKQKNLKINLSERENRWHVELDTHFGIDFWNKVYALNSSIKNENKLKYLQFQINRNNLFTNYKVNKFKENISPFCNFCSYNDGSTDLHLEVVSHLFHDCRLVQKLWREIGTWLMGFDLQISVDKKVLLFGKIDQSSSSIENVLILTTKYYIWITRCQNAELNFIAYKRFLKSKLEDLKNACLMEDKNSSFDQWLSIYDCL